MKLDEIPIYIYSLPHPFSTDETGYSEIFLLEIQRAFLGWAGVSEQEVVFNNYYIKQNTEGLYYLEKVLFEPPLDTLAQAGYGTPYVWTMNPYGIPELAPDNHHGKSNGAPFLPGELADYGKNYAGNYWVDLKGILESLLAEQNASMDWWAQHFKELTWEPNWSNSGIWTEFGTRDDGVNRYNLLTDHVEMMRSWPRTIVRSPTDFVDARLQTDIATGSCPAAYDIVDGVLVPQEGMVAHLEDCWVYEDRVVYHNLDTVDLTQYGKIMDGCSAHDGYQWILHENGTITVLQNHLIVPDGNQPIMARYGDGRLEPFGPGPTGSYYGIEYAPLLGLDYGIEPFWTYTLVLAGDEISYITASADPVEFRVRSRMDYESGWTGVCQEQTNGLAKEGRAWEWRHLVNKENSLKVLGWGVGMPGTGVVLTSTPSEPEYLIFQPTGVYMRMTSPVGGGDRATDSYPPPEQHWRFLIPDPYTDWTLARYSITQDAGRGYLHILLVEDDSTLVQSGGATSSEDPNNIVHLYWPLPNSIQLNGMKAETTGIYNPPTFTMTDIATVVPISFPVQVEANYSGSNHTQDFQDWRVGNMSGAGASSQWVFSCLYWRQEIDPTGIDISTINYDYLEAFRAIYSTQNAATLTSSGWALLRPGPASRLVPEGSSLDDQINNFVNGTYIVIANTVTLLNWHSQGGMLVSGIRTYSGAGSMVATYTLKQTSEFVYDFNEEDAWLTDVLKPVFENSTAFIGLVE